MKLLTSIFLLLLSMASFGQGSITGHVFDAATNTPLPGAHVFIANTTKGVSTDANGAFELTGLQPINYELVVSFVGYGTQAFDVIPGQTKEYKVMLGPAVIKLREVIVRSKRQTLALLKDFKDHFIGLSENAPSCIIENPDVLFLDDEKNILTAATDSTLLIRNNALGYRIKVFLETYEYNKGTTRLYYEGLMAFEALTPKNEKEKKRWAKNRLKAYYGSQMHFFRALYNRKLDEEGFDFRLRNSKVDYTHILDSTSTREQPVLKFKDLLQVTYIHERELVSYQQQRNLPVERKMQTSQLKLKAPALVLSDGRAYPVDAIEARGYWSWELMAEYLPLDYEPEE